MKATGWRWRKRFGLAAPTGVRPGDRVEKIAAAGGVRQASRVAGRDARPTGLNHSSRPLITDN